MMLALDAASFALFLGYAGLAGGSAAIGAELKRARHHDDGLRPVSVSEHREA
jgi:hypothetical protein